MKYGSYQEDGKCAVRKDCGMKELTSPSEIVYTIPRKGDGIMMPLTEAQKRAQRKYETESTKQFKMRLHFIHDADILKKLESVTNRTGYIKALIREDIKKGGQK